MDAVTQVGERVVFKADLATRCESARCGTVREVKPDGWLMVEFDHLPGFLSLQDSTWVESLSNARP